MRKAMWLVGAMAVLAAGVAQAQEKTMAYVAPFGGYNHLTVDSGRVYNQSDTVRFDALELGASFGFRFPVGLLLEVGRSTAVHSNIFDNDADYDLTQSYGAVGWRIGFADGWHLIPKVGRERWILSSDHKILIDDAGDRHHSIDGWENFWEIGLSHELNKKISLGVNFRDVSQDFGHTRIGTFVATFAF
jgi:hypothetical protein